MIGGTKRWVWTRMLPRSIVRKQWGNFHEKRRSKNLYWSWWPGFVGWQHRKVADFAFSKKRTWWVKNFFPKLLKILKPLWFLISFSGTVLYSGSIDICPESSGDWIKWVPGQFYGGTWQRTTEKTLCNEMTKEPSGWTEWSQWSSESFNIYFYQMQTFRKHRKICLNWKTKIHLIKLDYSCSYKDCTKTESRSKLRQCRGTQNCEGNNAEYEKCPRDCLGLRKMCCDKITMSKNAEIKFLEVNVSFI